MQVVHSHDIIIDMNLALKDLCYGNFLDDGNDEDPYEPCAWIKLQAFKKKFCKKPLFI